MMQSRPPFGTLLRKLRLDAELSQEALAERARISPQAIGALERGARQAPRKQTLDLLAEALGLDRPAADEFEAAALASVKARVRIGGGANERGAPLLPHSPTSFIGRQKERDDVAALLRPGRCTTLWGTGGIGKTRLALETARSVYDRYPDGIWFVELALFSDDADVAPAVMSATGVREEEGSTIADTLVKGLATKRALLVLDNAEHVLSGSATLVERFLRDAPTLAIACTSREPLRVGGETVYQLEPLPIPDSDDPELANAPAIRLFLDRATSAGARLDPTPDTLRAVALICRRLDAIPLAIELAAARTPMMTATEIATGLDDRFRLLARGTRTATPRQKTLHGVLDWSFTLLSDAERTVLRRVSIRPGSWTIDDAVAVAGSGFERWDIVDALAGLVDRSLVNVVPQTDGDERRYRLLQTTAAYALERLAEAGEFASVERLAAERMAALVHEAAETWRGNGDERRFRVLETPAVRAALRYAISLRSDVRLGAMLAGEAAKFWDIHSMHLEGLRWIETALAALPADGDDAARIAALLGRARLYRWSIRHHPTYDAAREAIALADRMGDTRSGAIARMQLAGAACATGREREGRAALDEGAALFEAIGDLRGRDSALWEYATVAYQSGDYAEARDRLRPLAIQSRERGATRQYMQAQVGLAETEFVLGNTTAAIEHGYLALDVARAVEDTLQTGTALQNLSAYLLEFGNVEEATALARESLELFTANGFDVHASISIGHLADALSRCGYERDAAILIGYSDHRLALAGTVREPTERRVRERSMAACARALDATELRDRLAEGAALDGDDAVNLALDLTEREVR